MNLQEVIGKLCYYDSRNPTMDSLGLSEDELKAKMEDCYCDNCYYGRTKLANEIIRLTEDSQDKTELIGTVVGVFRDVEIMLKNKFKTI